MFGPGEIGVVVVLVAGVFFGVYRLGYRVGRAEGRAELLERDKPSA